MNILELSEQEIIRRNSLNELRAMGIDPYPAAEYVTNAFSTDIKAEFKDEDEPRQVSVAGRIMSRRVMGKASFIELQDSKGRIQVYITRDDICPGEDKELYNAVFKRLLDLGDFIGIEGFVFRTQMGEISIHAKKLTVLAKSIKPLPIVIFLSQFHRDQCSRSHTDQRAESGSEIHQRKGQRQSGDSHCPYPVTDENTVHHII